MHSRGQKAQQLPASVEATAELHSVQPLALPTAQVPTDTPFFWHTHDPVDRQMILRCWAASSTQTVVQRTMNVDPAVQL